MDILWICTCDMSGYPVTFLLNKYVTLSIKSSQGNVIIRKGQFDLWAAVKEKIK